MKKFLLTLVVSSLLFHYYACAQTASFSTYFREVSLKTDTATYSLSNDGFSSKGDRVLPFFYSREETVCEVQLYPYSFANTRDVQLLASGDFEIIDSVRNINNQYYRFKVKFSALSRSQFLAFTFSLDDRKETTYELRLFPHTYTQVSFYPKDDELFIGEEKTFELETNNLRNLRIDNTWKLGEDIDYRFSVEGTHLRLHIVPKKLGAKIFEVELQTLQPFLDKEQNVTYKLPLIKQKFNVKASRLGFLNVDQKEVTLDDISRKQGVEIQLDNSRLLALHKTYRIEDQEQPGGPLIGELYTRSSLSNGRVLCWLRLFNYHRQSEGYLYIKDGDVAHFITNFSITPKTTIQTISILRDGADWTTNLSIRPGETFELRIEGEGLHKANFQFDELTKIIADSLIRNENVSMYKLKVPLNISKRKVEIYNNGQKTGQALSVREFQAPHPLNFIYLNYGETNKAVTSLNQPVFYDRTIRDLVITFAANQIDVDNKLYGKQYLSIDIRITGNHGELVEMKTINTILVCPGDNSPRFAFYADGQCNKADINLNAQISRKTYDLDDWSRIELVFRHDKEKYGGEGVSQKVEIILKKAYKFDTEVSFPAGLLIKQFDKEGFNPLGGVSLAVIGQFSFYHPDKIARYRPYKIGAGFLAFNAFNLSQSASIDRDVGVVLLASLYPTRRDVKLTFPLFLGGGYYLSKSKWFIMIGPGIQLRL